DSVPLAQVVGMEAYRTSVSITKSVLGSVSLAALAGATAIAISCIGNPKCFGSCPTAYSDNAGKQLLEAEGLSYALAPVFEMRDVDRLRASADTAGTVRLEVRNEALETHYINHLELLDVPHAREEFVVPDAGGSPIAMRGLEAPRSATDRAGRDVRRLLA